MPRNNNGVYTLPVAAFTPGQVIKAGDTNANNVDIGTALTQSLATTGVSFMAAPLRLAVGTALQPALSFASDIDTGLYSIGSGEIAFVSNSSVVMTINDDLSVSFVGSITVAGEVDFANNVTFGGEVTFSQGIIGPLPVTRTENDTSNRTFISLGFGNRSGVGVNFNGVGGGANNIATFQLASSLGVDLLDIDPVTQIVTIPGFLGVGNYIDFTDISTPSAPSTGATRVYTKGGQPFYIPAGGSETSFGNFFFVQEYTVAALSAQQDIPIPAGCQILHIDAVNWVTSGAATIQMLFSQDGGTTFLAGTNYTYNLIQLSGTTISNANAGAGAAAIQISNVTATPAQQFNIKIVKPLASGIGGVTGYSVYAFNPASSVNQTHGVFRLIGNANAITTIRLKPSTGTITSATIRVRMET